MFEQLIGLFDMYQQENGSILFCVRDMHARAAARGWDDVVGRADHAHDECLVVQRVEYDWRQYKASGPATRDEAVRLDAKVDRTASQIATIAQTFAETEVDSPMRQAGRVLVEEVFPSGVFPVTSLRHEEEHRAVAELVDRLRGDYRAQVDTLGLSQLVDTLADLNDRFGSALGETAVPVTWDQVLEARASAREAYAKLLIAGLARTLDDPDARADFFSSVRDQQARIARYIARRGTTPAIDPTTGEPVEPTEPTDDAQPTQPTEPVAE